MPETLNRGELLLVELKVDDKRLSGLPEDKELYEVVHFFLFVQ